MVRLPVSNERVFPSDAVILHLLLQPESALAGITKISLGAGRSAELTVSLYGMPTFVSSQQVHYSHCDTSHRQCADLRERERRSKQKAIARRRTQ